MVSPAETTVLLQYGGRKRNKTRTHSDITTS
jgi:hypothetical protein